MTYIDRDNKAIEEIKRRIQDNEYGRVWITDEEELNTKDVVRNARRAYSGIFVEKNDDSVFWPLAKTVVDSVTANIDYDLSDIKVTSKSAKSRGTAYLISEFLRNKLKKAQFGRLMNEAGRQLATDGIVLIRTNHNDARANNPESYLVDTLNFWTDFNTDKPDWFAERAIVPRYKVPKSWNKEYLTDERVSKFKNIGDKVIPNSYVCYRYEGMMPLGWINGTNDEEEVYGLLWITNLETDKPYIQSRKVLGKDMDVCSYDFCQFVPNQNRFISVGIPEAIQDLQKYMNLVINNRINRANLASMGLIEIRQGSGITPKDVKEIRAGAAITVKQIGTDIKSTAVQDVSAVSFNEEGSINNTVQKLTGNVDISIGQANPNATATQRNLEAGFASKRFQYHMEALGFMYESILNKWIKMIISKMDKEETIKISDEEILKEISQEQGIIDREQIAGQSQFGSQIMQNEPLLNKLTKNRIKNNEWKILKDKLIDFEYKIDITVNTETKNLQDIASNIVQTIPLLASIPNGQEMMGPLSDKLFEILGISKGSI